MLIPIEPFNFADFEGKVDADIVAYGWMKVGGWSWSAECNSTGQTSSTLGILNQQPFREAGTPILHPNSSGPRERLLELAALQNARFTCKVWVVQRIICSKLNEGAVIFHLCGKNGKEDRWYILLPDLSRIPSFIQRIDGEVINSQEDFAEEVELPTISKSVAL